MLRTFLRLLTAAFVSGMWVLAQQPAQPDYTLKVDVPFAFVDVTVQDSGGNAINNLPQDAFDVYENGVRQQIRYFSPVSAPYDILLLFDRSGSTAVSADRERVFAGDLHQIRGLREDSRDFLVFHYFALGFFNSASMMGRSFSMSSWPL